VPLLTSQWLSWSGCELYVEAVHPRDGGPAEAALALPPWDELVGHVVAEDLVWELIDTFAAAVGGTCGAIVDGEALSPEPPCRPADWRAWMRRHLAVLVPAGEAATLEQLGCAYCTLPQSGLSVLVR